MISFNRFYYWEAIEFVRELVGGSQFLSSVTIIFSYASSKLSIQDQALMLRWSFYGLLPRLNIYSRRRPNQLIKTIAEHEDLLLNILHKNAFLSSNKFLYSFNTLISRYNTDFSRAIFISKYEICISYIVIYILKWICQLSAKIFLLFQLLSYVNVIISFY